MPAPASSARSADMWTSMMGWDGPPADPGQLAVPGPPVPEPPLSPQRAIIRGHWPHHDTLELGSLPGAVPCARLHAKHVLREWGLTRLADDTEILLSELVTNAIAASRVDDNRDPVRFWLLADSASVLVLVWDASPQAPTPTDADEDAENGRGLLLIEAISRQWDWYRPQHGAGKVVWALAGTPQDRLSVIGPGSARRRPAEEAGNTTR